MEFLSTFIQMKTFFFHESFNFFKAITLWLRMVCDETQNKAIFLISLLLSLWISFLLVVANINLLNYHWFPENYDIYLYFKYRSNLSGLNSWCNKLVIKSSYIGGFHIQYWFLHEEEQKPMVYKMTIKDHSLVYFPSNKLKV